MSILIQKSRTCRSVTAGHQIIVSLIFQVEAGRPDGVAESNRPVQFDNCDVVNEVVLETFVQRMLVHLNCNVCLVFRHRRFRALHSDADHHLLGIDHLAIAQRNAMAGGQDVALQTDFDQPQSF